MAESGVKQRIKEFVAYLKVSEREFCRTIGVSSSFIVSIKQSIKADKLQAITSHYPELNPVWLMMGQGEMLLKDKKPETKSDASEMQPTAVLAKLLEEVQGEKARLLSIIESQQRTIETLGELAKKGSAQPGEAAGCAVAG